MTKWVDESALQYFRKRTEVQSTGNTITISEKSNKRFPGTLTKSDIDVNLDNIIDNNTILKNNNKLKSGLTLAKITTGLPTKVKERYALKDNQGNVIGSEINIYYDSSLVEVYLGNTDDRLTNVPDPSTGKKYTIIKSVSGEDALCFVFILDTGLYELVSVPVGDFLRESEFKDGLNVSNHEVSAKISDGLEFGNAGIGVNKPVKIKLHNKYVGPSVALRDGISVLNVDSNGLSLDLENLLQRSFKSSSYINLVLTQAGASPLSTGQVLLPILQPEANVVTISSATSQNNGLATANDVKQYIEGNTYWRSDGTYQTSGIYTESNTASGTYSVAEGYDSTAGANYSHAEGCQTAAIGLSSHAEGESTTASGDQSHAEGDGTTASGNMSHAEGNDTSAQGNYSHAEGISTSAVGTNSHAEGNATSAIGMSSHAEGDGTSAYGDYSHSEGSCIYALGNMSHAEGQGFVTRSNFTISGLANSTTYQSSVNHGLSEGIIIGYYISSEDKYRFATVVNVLDNTHFVVDKTLDDTQSITNEYIHRFTGVSYGNYSHSEGNNTIAKGIGSHSEGFCQSTDSIVGDITAIGTGSHAEGYVDNNGGNIRAIGVGSHAEGFAGNALCNIAIGDGSHVEGGDSCAEGDFSHAEGLSTSATGGDSHSEGNSTMANGDHSHSEGLQTVADGQSSHAEGDKTIAFGNVSHAEGDTTLAYGANSHAEGIGSSELMTSFTISGGAGTTGYVSSQNHGLIEGSIIKYGNIYAMVTEVTNSTHFILDKTLSNEALVNVNVYIITGVSYGANSHSEGKNTIASNEAEHACGKYNVSTPGQTLFSVGNGTSDSDRRNAFEVTQDGNIIGGSFSSGISTQTINTADTTPVVTKSESIILLDQDVRIPPLLDLESFSMSPGQHVTIFLTHTFNSLSVSLILGYTAYIYTQGNVDYKLGPEVHNISAQYSKIDIVRISTHQWTITLY